MDLGTIAGIIALLRQSYKVTQEVLDAVDQRAAASGTTRQQVFADVAAAALHTGEHAVADVAGRASRITARGLSAYDAMPAWQKMLTRTLLPGGSLLLLRDGRRSNVR